ncbi:MAG: RNA polymerase sigma-70 factor [Cytophagales bacterium]|nr:RNA polymerase sigma-70 factor [Cytophagales bacterium]
MLKTDQLRALIEKISYEDCRHSFKILFDHYFPQLFDIAQYYLKSTFLAEEAVSDVFVKVWNGRFRLIEVIDLKSYFFIAIKRQCLSYLKKERKNLLYIDDLEFEVLLHARSSDWGLMNEELMDIYRKAIKKLPEKCRIIYLMAKDRQLKYKEIAAVLNISPKTVETQMHTALKRIRIVLDEYLKGHSRQGNSQKRIEK